MKFIGRQSELRTLEQEYRRDGGFVVIYGRRRVGKTRLIKEFIKDKPAVYFLGVRRWLSLVENVSCDDQSVYPALRRDLPVNAPEYLREQRMFDVRRDVGVIE